MAMTPEVWQPKQKQTSRRSKGRRCSAKAPAGGSGPASGRQCLQTSQIRFLSDCEATTAAHSREPNSSEAAEDLSTRLPGGPDYGRHGRCHQGQRLSGGCHGDRRDGAGEDGAGALCTAGGVHWGATLENCSSQIKIEPLAIYPKALNPDLSGVPRGSATATTVWGQARTSDGESSWCACGRDVTRLHERRAPCRTWHQRNEPITAGQAPPNSTHEA